MTTSNIQSLLDRRVALISQLRTADNFQKSLDANPLVEGIVQPSAGNGLFRMDPSLTQHILLGITEDLSSELAAVELKLQAVNTLLAD